MYTGIGIAYFHIGVEGPEVVQEINDQPNFQH